jgi:uncharacterized protein YbjQ (UPF0145 family)
MLIATTWNVAGHRIVETLGEVVGLTVRGRGLFANIGAAIRALFGGEMRFYTNMLGATRERATAHMHARRS